MILLLDTSTPVCQLTLIDGDIRYDYEWQADRQLAHDLHGFIRDKLLQHDKVFADIHAIGAMKGPGSFTGLRIGLTVLNTIADTLEVPIVGVAQSDNWQDEALRRLSANENDKLVLPFYGREANITKPRK